MLHQITDTLLAEISNGIPTSIVLFPKAVSATVVNGVLKPTLIILICVTLSAQSFLIFSKTGLDRLLKKQNQSVTVNIKKVSMFMQNLTNAIRKLSQNISDAILGGPLSPLPASTSMMAIMLLSTITAMKMTNLLPKPFLLWIL